MNDKETLEWIELLDPDTKIALRYYWSKRHKWYKYTAFASSAGYWPAIYLNRDRWFDVDDDTQRILMAHEIGHFKTKHAYSNSMAMREFGSQQWSINRLKYIGETRLSNFAKRKLREWGTWEYHEWRRYNRAAKIAKQMGLI